MQTPTVSPEGRQAILAGAVAFEVRQHGAVVLGGTPYIVTLEYGSRPDHILHLLLSIVTCGVWLLIWMLLTMTNPPARRNLRVDEYGRLWWE